jgi:cobalt/nickel transport system ATP-binding protein
MEAGALIRVERVSYSYLGRHRAVVDASLSVERGERVVILGANGCGKSTLLKLMDGLLRPDAGRLEAFGTDITRASSDPALARWLHRRVGLVFQDSDVQLFSPTVWDDVAFGPLQMGWAPTQVRQSAERALESMGVAHLAERAPYELSEGEKKRVAIATVLALEPELLLLDEPTASLDPRSKAVLLELIETMNEQGRTVVTTTQELEVASIVGRRAVVFGDIERRPVAEGPVASILENTELLVQANLVHPRLRWRI